MTNDAKIIMLMKIIIITHVRNFKRKGTMTLEIIIINKDIIYSTKHFYRLHPIYGHKYTYTWHNHYEGIQSQHIATNSTEKIYCCKLSNVMVLFSLLKT